MDNHFTNQAEEQYGSDLINEAEAYLGRVGTEALFAVRNQIDMIAAAEDVELGSLPEQEDWSLVGFVRRSKDVASVIAANEKPSGPIAMSLAKAMGEILGDAVLRAQVAKADEEENEAQIKEISERVRCLTLMRASLSAVEEKILSGDGHVLTGPAAESVAFIEVNPDGSPVKSDGRKAKESVKKSRKKAGDAAKAKPIVTASGLTIRVD